MGVLAILVMWPGQFKHIFVSEGYIWNMVTTGLLAFEEMFEFVKFWYFLGQRSNKNLHLLFKTTLFTIFMPKSSKLSIKSYVLAFSHIWPCRKKGQGQPKVIICIFLVVLRYLMLHTKFQGHRSISSREEDILRFLPYMGMAATLVMRPYSFV